MRIAITSLLLAMAAATPAYALDDLTAFPLLQEECAQMGDITFGDHGRWATCRVVKGRWFATIDFTDFYQAQYCLGKDGEQCEQMAQLVFANRAYTPVGQRMVQRIDPAGTQYHDPVIFVGDYGRILVLSGDAPGNAVSRSYYRWESSRWLPLEAQKWLTELPYQLSDASAMGKPAATDGAAVQAPALSGEPPATRPAQVAAKAN